MRLLCITFGLTCLASLLGCSPRESWGTKSVTVLGPGVLNDPQNRSLRFDILEFGLDALCTEMKRRGVALRLSDDHPVLGRFFATDCESEVIDEEHRKSIMVRFSGQGYAWTNMTDRLGFSVLALVEYAPDFQLAEDRSMYVYFRPRNVQTATFETKLVESTLANTALRATGLDPNRLGQRILSSQLDRGFSVIRRDDNGEMDYALGMVPLGTRPFRPFEIVSSKLTLSNERTELHTGQQDYIGPFEITESSQALTITATVDGGPHVDLLLVPGLVGRQMLDRYVSQPGASALTALAITEDVVRYGSVTQRTVPVHPGSYFLVMDNSAAVGQAPSVSQDGSDRAVKVDFAVQLGDAP